MSKKLALIVLGTVLTILIPIEIFGVRLLYKYGYFARLVPVANLDYIQTGFNKTGLGILADKFHNKNPLVLLQQVMNTVGKVEPQPFKNAFDIYRNALKERGTLCDGMAELYFSVLRLNGIKARLVYLTKNLYDIYDTHSTVEVFWNGKWVIFDPTFHVSFERNGILLSSQEIKDSLYNGLFYDIKPVFYGEVNYPARIEDYYLHWLPLFNNVFVVSNNKTAFWGKIPPFRYWLGSRLLYQKENKSSDFHLRFHNSLVFFFMVAIPIIISVSFFLFVLLLIRVRIKCGCKAVNLTVITN